MSPDILFDVEALIDSNYHHRIGYRPPSRRRTTQAKKSNTMSKKKIFRLAPIKSSPKGKKRNVKVSTTKNVTSKMKGEVVTQSLNSVSLPCRFFLI